MSDVADIEARLRAAEEECSRLRLAATRVRDEASREQARTDQKVLDRERERLRAAEERAARLEAACIVVCIDDCRLCLLCSALAAPTQAVPHDEDCALVSGTSALEAAKAEAVRDAVAAEREACAALCDRTEEHWREQEQSASDDFKASRCFARADVAVGLARAIRARGGR